MHSSLINIEMDFEYIGYLTLCYFITSCITFITRPDVIRYVWCGAVLGSLWTTYRHYNDSSTNILIYLLFLYVVYKKIVESPNITHNAICQEHYNILPNHE